MKLKTLIICAVASASLQAFPWSQKGHDVVAAIAENHLTPTTRAKVDSLLQGMSMVYWANWLDNASHTPEYAYSKTWHYKNVDADETFRGAQLHPSGDIVRADNAQYAVLRDSQKPEEERSLALKMLIHFAGDIHQPMHLGHASDLGGNRHFVKFFKEPTNLHRLWDEQVVEAGHNWSFTEWREQIDRASKQRTEEILTENCPEKWAAESYELSKEIYAKTPAGTNISYDYIAEWTPVIEERLLRGGLRLADQLNTALDPGYKGFYMPY